MMKTTTTLTAALILTLAAAPALAEEAPPAAPAKAAEKPAPKPTEEAPTQRVKRPGYTVAGSITLGIGAVTTAAGLGLILGDDGSTLGVGPMFGGLLTAFGIVHISIGIPLVAVGAQPYRKEVADAPGLDALELEFDGKQAGLKLTF